MSDRRNFIKNVFGAMIGVAIAKEAPIEPISIDEAKKLIPAPGLIRGNDLRRYGITESGKRRVHIRDLVPQSSIDGKTAIV